MRKQMKNSFHFRNAICIRNNFNDICSGSLHACNETAEIFFWRGWAIQIRWYNDSATNLMFPFQLPYQIRSNLNDSSIQVKQNLGLQNVKCLDHNGKEIQKPISIREKNFKDYLQFKVNIISSQFMR